MLKDKKINLAIFFITLISFYFIYPQILYEFFVYKMPYGDKAPKVALRIGL